MPEVLYEEPIRPAEPVTRHILSRLLIGYFEGLESERGIVWRTADSLSLRKFLGYTLEEKTPDHSTISRTRRLYWLETHKAVFSWVLKILSKEGLISRRTIWVDATTLEANAALRNIVRRDNGQSYHDYLTELARAEGMENPTREQLARVDRKRKKKGSNEEWTSPSDPDARITKMKDGSTHLAHKGEHAVDLTSGALVAMTLQPASALRRAERRCYYFVAQSDGRAGLRFPLTRASRKYFNADITRRCLKMTYFCHALLEQRLTSLRKRRSGIQEMRIEQ